jgi:NAD(P)-dependent dehydrogenase (short-subunit alcohol dehydrogenase family)
VGEGRDVGDAPPPELLAGRVALVTGGARGLGAAIAAAFARSGATGSVVDVEAGASPDGWLALAVDVTDEETIAGAVAATVERFGRLDVVVANAGVVPPWTETSELDLEELDRVLAVNVRGVAATIKHAVPALRERGGSIVVMASLNAHRAHPRQHAYTASKHAVLGLARSAALDLGRFGIRVNALGPGPVLTDALRGRIERRAAEGGLPAEEALREYADTAIGRMVTEQDVANAALFLASDLSAGITGALLPVDGGLA